VTRTTIVTGALYQLGLERRYWLPLGILALILFVGAGLFVVQFIRANPASPTRMVGGGLNVAIAEFSVAGAQAPAMDKKRAGDLGQVVHSTLSERSRATSYGRLTATWPPQWTGSIDGPDRAARRAQEIDADVIVYGTLLAGDDATQIQPRFYLSARLLGDATELARAYDLGAQIESSGQFSRNSATFDELKETLLGRIDALDQMLYGLGQYQRGDFKAAATAFADVDKRPAWPGQTGKEVLYLFAGWSAAKLGQERAARD
jgi:hypothetical protein